MSQVVRCPRCAQVRSRLPAVSAVAHESVLICEFCWEQETRFIQSGLRVPPATSWPVPDPRDYLMGLS